MTGLCNVFGTVPVTTSEAETGSSLRVGGRLLFTFILQQQAQSLAHASTQQL